MNPDPLFLWRQLQQNGSLSVAQAGEKVVLAEAFTHLDGGG